MTESAQPRPEARAQAAPSGASASPAPAATVLLVDDEPVVRRLVETVLRSKGYEVVAAASGDEALQLLSRPVAQSYRVLVSDVVMPGPGGFDIAARFLASHPGARAVLMSGSITADEVNDPRFDDRVDFLAKPFRAAALLERVERSLARAAAYSASVVSPRAA